MNIGIVVSMCVGSLGHNFLLVHDVTFGDGILNVLHRRRLKEEKKLILLCMSSPQRSPYSLVVLFFKRLLHCQQGNTKYIHEKNIIFMIATFHIFLMLEKST